MAPASAEVVVGSPPAGEAVAVAPAEVVVPAVAVEHPAEVPAVVARAAGPERPRTADPADLHAHHPRASDCHAATSTQRPQ